VDYLAPWNTALAGTEMLPISPDDDDYVCESQVGLELETPTGWHIKLTKWVAILALLELAAILILTSLGMELPNF